MTGDQKPIELDHIELHSLLHGGYVVREGRYNGDTGDSRHEWRARYELAAFSTLDEALKWLAKNTRMMASKR